MIIINKKNERDGNKDNVCTRTRREIAQRRLQAMSLNGDNIKEKYVREKTSHRLRSGSDSSRQG